MDSNTRTQTVEFEKFIGKRLKQDTFNRSGTLVAGAHTILDMEQLKIIHMHQIVLKESDVEFAGPYGTIHPSELGNVIDNAVLSIQRVFDEAGSTRNIALDEIRKTITPLIRQIIEQQNLFNLLGTLQEKDDYLYRHSIAVGVISALFGKWLNFKEADLLQLTTAAVLHNIGMTRLPKQMMNKTDMFTSEGLEEMKRHTIFGYEMLKKTVGISYIQALVAIQHHERLDGTGYPFGTKEGKIHIFSRIVSIADVFYSMTSKKEQGDPSPFYEVLLQIGNNTYGELDTSITNLLVDKVMQSLIGYEVMLTNGSKGKIIMINPHDALHPLVHVGETFIDLSKQSEVRIEQVLAAV